MLNMAPHHTKLKEAFLFINERDIAYSSTFAEKRIWQEVLVDLKVGQLSLDHSMTSCH